MWNPFSRVSKTVAEAPAPEETAGRRGAGGRAASELAVVHTPIAEIERMGSTAVATLTVTDLTQERGVEQLSSLLREMINTGAKNFVLDIQNVQFMDSACLGCLVQALNQQAKSGGRIALANTAHSVQYLFRLTQLDRVFPICADVMAALAVVERSPE